MSGPSPHWRPQSPDTDFDAEQVQFAIWRRMEPWRRLAMMEDLHATACAMAEQFERRRHPDADDEEIRLRVFARRLDRATMLAAFGRDPARDP